MLNKAINGFEQKLGPTKFGALATMFGKVFSAFISYVTLVIIARLLSVDDFGIYSFFLSLVGFLVVIASAGSENILLSIVSKRKEKGNNYFQQTILSVLSLVILFSISVILFLLLSQRIIEEIVTITNYREILLIVIWVVFFQAIIIYFRALNQSEFLFIKAIVPENIIRPSILFLLVILGYFKGINDLKIMTISYSLSFFLTVVIVVKWKMDLFRGLNIREYWFDKEVFRLSPQFMSIQLLSQASNFIPVLLMSIFLTSDAIGIFRASQQTTILVSFVSISINMVFAPTISNLFNKNKLNELKAFYANTTKWTFVFGGYISILVMLNSEILLSLFGQEYKKWNMVLIILSFGQLINASTGSSGYLLLMTRNQKYMIFLTSIQVITVFILSLFTVNYLGVYGIAFSVTVGIILLNILTLFYVWWKLDIHPISTQYIGVIFTIIISTLATWIFQRIFVNQISIISSIISSIIFSAIFIVMFLRLGLNKIERKKGVNIIKSTLTRLK